ncbi:hypothetical protein JOQ06_010864 [Pogonophryne albipinna]|uniref:SET domain-containing protein n=1 Tax=Pogonophryne albipinna TaxID=1090488 RepID=A0AAD6FG11_9TELE|nr:hypothetical protein JOQ06_010864 [Pogonophryne albipinna]
MQRRRRITPKDDATFYIDTGGDKAGLDVQYINAIKGELKVFMFDFHFDGKLWCVDAAKEDESLGRLVNDDHRNPTAKMRQLSVQGKPHLCLFADRDISPGEEITYNYGDSDWPWRCKGLDEVMPLETCGATQTTSPNENIEEMVKNSDCTESYMKTTGPVLSPLSRAEKWLGYECRECSQVWHKSCFRNIQDDNLHYLPKPKAMEQTKRYTHAYP